MFSFQSSRKFTLFGYHASHGILLLRSGKNQNVPTRIDVLFKDVRALEIRAWIDHLGIEEQELSFLEDFKSNPHSMAEPGNRAYRVSGSGWFGYVLAGTVSVREDDLELTEKSSFPNVGY